MKIVIFNTLYYPNNVGGAEKSVQSLAESLVKKGQNVTVISTSNKTYEDIIHGVKVYYVKTQNIYWGYDNTSHSSVKKTLWHTIDSYNLGIKNTVLKILNHEKPDIVHTNNLSGFSVVIWDILNKHNYKIIHTLRDYHLLCPKATMFKNSNNCKSVCTSCRIFSIPKKSKSNLVNAVIGVSSFILKKHIHHGYFKNANIKTVIGNDVGNIIQEKNIIEQTIVFGFIGQVTKAKGTEYLLSTFSTLNKFKNWKLLIAGKGDDDYIKHLKKTYKHKQIDFLGSVNSSDYYPKINCLIVPSLWEEPFGRVVIEGIKYGKHVIGSNRGGITELLNPNQLFDPNTSELKQIIQHIIVSKKLPLSIDYTHEDITDKYIALYKKLSLQKTDLC